MHRSVILRSLVVAILGVMLAGVPAALAQHASAPPAALPSESPPLERRTLTVTGTGEASAPAETATLRFAVSEESFGPPVAPAPGSTPGARERDAVAPIVDALVATGVSEDSIEVIVGPYVSEAYGPSGPAMAIFTVDLTDPAPEGITALVDAATVAAADDRRIISGIGVTYGVEDCAALEHAAREHAIADARQRAEDQAGLLDVTVGDLVASRDLPVADATGFVPYGPLLPPPSSCSPIEISDFALGQIGISTFDPSAPAEVTVYARVELTFAMVAGAEATPAS